MKRIHQVFNYQRLREESAWRLLTLDHAPIALALLQQHLLDKDRSLPHSVLLERLKQDLLQLQAEGVEMPQPAEAYLSAWLRAGFLVREFREGAAEEEYRLSTSAVRAVQFVEGLQDRRAVATESRLSLVLHQLQEIARQTEPDTEVRLQALAEQRERLEREMAQVQAGEMALLPDERALEKAREAIALARELASDFRRVQEEFQRLNRDLRERIVTHEGSRGEVLEQIFSGVDLIADSEAGQSFRAFWRLLTDPEQSLALELALERVLSRDFARRLERQERRFLVGMTRVLLDNGGEVHEVIQRFARGLKQFVQSRAYQEQRRLHQLLGESLREARDAREAWRPFSPIGLELVLSSAKVQSVAQWELHDPSTDRLDAGIQPAPEAEISLEAVGELLAQSEIDFRRLEEQVRSLLVRISRVTVAGVLEHYPAEQGLGSVVGLLALGARQGVRSTGFERVCWRGLDKVERCARIPKFYFVDEQGDAATG